MFSESVYTKRIADDRAIYFDAVTPDLDRLGETDMSDQLQAAINMVVEKEGYGILYVPEGKYLLSRTIYVPKAVRIIGFGPKRPEFILTDNAPGFDIPEKNDKGGYKYLFWFCMKHTDKEILDADPGTFYSAMSNVNIRLGKGNDCAAALRTHYAQHCFLSHMNIDVDSGVTAVYDGGNEMDNIRICGGSYGIITTKTSAGWPFVLVDVSFANQKCAAIKTREAGITVVRASCINTDYFIDADEGYFEKIYIRDSIFEEMSSVISAGMSKNELTQFCIHDCYMRAVENVVEFRDVDRKISNNEYQTCVKKYIHGPVASDQDTEKTFHDQIYRYASGLDFAKLKTDIPSLPHTGRWANAKELGLLGDGVSDDTVALKDAVSKYDTIFFPQGIYLVSDTIKLGDRTAFIGMHPLTTQIKINDNSPKFTGFGKMKPVIDSSDGSNIIRGIGIDTGGRNPRACGIRWSAGEDSLIDDVKIVGGHGALKKYTAEFDTPYDEGRVRDRDINRIWDYQYPGIVVRGGGGVIKNVWSASPYSGVGLQFKNVNKRTRVYCLSLEHHGRCELKMNDSSNVEFYGFQCEEEKPESEYCVPVEMQNCHDIMFATCYFFRTIFVDTPMDYCVRTYSCKNINFFNVHNYSQMKYTISAFLRDDTEDVTIRCWQAACVKLTGNRKRNFGAEDIGDEPVLLYKGFRFADGGCCDGRGNFYFLDSLNKRVYRIDGESLEISVVFESHFKVNSIGFDTRDNMILIGEYRIPNDAEIDGIKIENVLPEDALGSSYSYWYSAKIITVAFSVDSSGQVDKLEKINIGEIKPERVLYPGNRWRDRNDCEKVLTYNPGKAYIARDGATIIPCQYDLTRANNLAKSRPGKHLYSVDELYKRVYMCDIDEYGMLKNPRVIINEGDYRVRKLNSRFYVGEDNIRVFGEQYKYERTIEIPERPITFDFGGRDRKLLFVTTKDSIYVVKES